MKNGSILANAGHFNVEISIDALKSNSILVKQVNENTAEYELKKGTKLYLIAEGRLVNLVAAEGHPSEVMDMSFANQLLSSIKLIQSKGSLSPAVYEIERSQDQEIARAKLESMDINIDILTEEQNTYLTGFSEGT
jgi:adenosylhomocysteinase